MESSWGTAIGDCSTGKVESPVGDDATGHELQTANPEVTQLLSVSDSEEVKRLQNQVAELLEQNKSLETKLKYARKQKKELEEEVTELVQENSEFKNGERYQGIVNELVRSEDRVKSLLKENHELQKQLSLVTHQLQTPTLPDLESIRDSVVGNWKVAKRAESKERIKQAIDRFIEQLHTWLQNAGSMQSSMQPIQPSMQPSKGQDDEPKTAPSWESRALSFLGEVNWDG